jgi:hypothetical protein
MCEQMLNAMSRPNGVNRSIRDRRKIGYVCHHVGLQAGIDIDAYLLPPAEERWKPRVIWGAAPRVKEDAADPLGRFFARHRYIALD